MLHKKFLKTKIAFVEYRQKLRGQNARIHGILSILTEFFQNSVFGLVKYLRSALRFWGIMTEVLEGFALKLPGFFAFVFKRF
jgi:hypothetical protein